MAMIEAPTTLPAGVRLRCLQCGSQWEHGAWEGAPEGSQALLPHSCPMCSMALSYITNGSLKAKLLYELSATSVHYS